MAHVVRPGHAASGREPAPRALAQRPTELIFGAARESGAASTDAALRLTALILLLRPAGPWYAQAVAMAVGVVVLAVPQWRHASMLWLAAALAVGARLVADWPLPDNHYYLLAYWCAAIALALRAARPAESLATSSRVLVGLAFAFALLWKLALAPDFTDGRFFRVTLLTDERFTKITQVVGGLSAPELEADRTRLTAPPGGAVLLYAPEIDEPRRLRWFAASLTWGAIALELAVAALCLLPLGPRAAGARHAAIIAFCLTTYAIAPVAGFGWLLVAMGLAQCNARDRGWRAAYVATFVVVLLYSVAPWIA